eukprot:1086300-Prymnesium_polylepis.1
MARRAPKAVCAARRQRSLTSRLKSPPRIVCIFSSAASAAAGAFPPAREDGCAAGAAGALPAARDDGHGDDAGAGRGDAKRDERRAPGDESLDDSKL